MTEYILDHARDRDIVLIYESTAGITQRLVHVVTVTDGFIRATDGGKIKTFRRDRILSACWPLAGGPQHHMPFDRQ